MTETDLELFIKKVRWVQLTSGFNSVISAPIPGNIRLIFDYSDGYECIEVTKYLKKLCAGKEVHLVIKQIASDRLDLTFIVSTDEATILNIKGLECREDIIFMFFKKQPKDKNIYCFLQVNKPPDTIENMVAIMEAEMESGQLQPIQITSWKGTPLGTSEGDLTNR